MADAETVVGDVGERTSSCGYCKAPGYSSPSYGLWACSLTVDDFQELLDRGWRRSGNFLYKPDMKRTCCPSYTIRLKADEFKPSKEQCRVLKKVQRFLDGNQPGNTNCSTGLCNQSSQVSYEQMATETMIQGNEEKPDDNTFLDYLSARIDDAIDACKGNGELPSTVQLPRPNVKRVKSQVKKRLVNTSEDLLYTSNISFQICAVIRQSQKATCSNANQSGVCLEPTTNSIAEKLACSVNLLGPLQDMYVKACNGHLNFYSSIDWNGSGKLPAVRDVYQQSSKDVGHSAKHGLPLDKKLTMTLKECRLKIRMKRSSFDPEEYALYRRYQINVHDDKPEDITERRYTRFLVDTPLKFCPPQSGREVPSCGFGSFHQKYIIDGKLVAVGVVDILPKCFSSKYFFWDPDFAFLSLGKFSSLKEIEWVRDIQAQCHSLQYYYLGYYIHSCSKMKYKAAYHPSELLCPLRYRWVPFSIARPLLDKKSYVVLSDFMTGKNRSSSPGEPSCSEVGNDTQEGIPGDSLDKNDEERTFDIEGEAELDENTFSMSEFRDVDINNIVIDWNGIRMKFKDVQKVYRSRGERIQGLLKPRLLGYVKAVGADLASRMIYVPYEMLVRE